MASNTYFKKPHHDFTKYVLKSRHYIKYIMMYIIRHGLQYSTSWRLQVSHDVIFWSSHKHVPHNDKKYVMTSRGTENMSLRQHTPWNEEVLMTLKNTPSCVEYFCINRTCIRTEVRLINDYAFVNIFGDLDLDLWPMYVIFVDNADIIPAITK